MRSNCVLPDARSSSCSYRRRHREFRLPEVCRNVQAANLLRSPSTMREEGWQEGYYDHVLRDEEPTIGVAAYILHNPIRAGLSRTLEGYPLLGSDRYTLE